MKLGVCYYPEQWDEALWKSDAERMSALGLSVVRIGEFAWSRMEPAPGHFDWAWLDRAVETLAAAGLEIVMGTPTATPPKWLIDRHPDILPTDEYGRVRKFGSRRHYCFSSAVYRREAARIVEAMSARYGRNPAVIAWQTDNEYGCHDTVLSYSADAVGAFRRWLAARYGEVRALNRAWGAAFWSQDYRSFDEVDPPASTVTEANPAHRLDWQRFASDEVKSFNRLQTDILRRNAPGRDILHNFMGYFTAFDHHSVAEDLDIAAWDSYPLGFLELGPHGRGEKERFLRQGHPDFAGFHHDLYRGAGRGRMWVMEQQPGPVNWAPFNPAPLAGMVRTWVLEAFAHGAEVSSIFRWRQAPFAQEQMHAALNLRDNRPDIAFGEIAAVAAELPAIRGRMKRAPVALIFSYEADWLFSIQPQGRSFRYLEFVFSWYSALRRMGFDIDILPPGAPLEGYALIIAPSLPILRPKTMDALAKADGVMVFGPRTGSKTEDFQIPAELAPGPLGALLPLRVTRVESLRPDYREAVRRGNQVHHIERWLEHVETAISPEAMTESGRGVWFHAGKMHYLNAWPDQSLLEAVLEAAARAAGLDPLRLPDGLRLRRLGDIQFAFNYAPEALSLTAVFGPAPARSFRLGKDEIPPGGLAAWTI